MLIQAKEAWGFFFWDSQVTVIHSVGRINEQEITNGSNRAAAHVVLRHVKLRHHIQSPNDVRFVLVFVWFLREGAIVFIVSEAFGVEANHFAAARHIPESIAFDHGCTANALVWPIMDTAGRKFFTAMLPKYLAIFFIEAKKDTEIHSIGIAFDIPVAVICADVNFAVGNDWIAVGFRTERHGPADIGTGLDIEFGWHRAGSWNVIAFR